MKRILLLIFLLTGNTLFAQDTLTDQNGVPYLKKSSDVFVGSPFFYPKFLKANVRFSNGNSSSNYELKFDEINGQLIFLGEDGLEYAFVDEVKSFDLISEGERFSFYKEKLGKAYYQSLVEGNVSLFRRNIKSIVERKQYSSATIEKFVQSREVFYIKTGDVVHELNSQAALLKIFTNNQQVMDYLKKNNVSYKKKKSLIEFVSFINELK